MGEDGKGTHLKEKLKKAGKIILASFGTSIAAMVPLMYVGLGTLKGFAITALLTEAGAYFITRPAYLTVLRLGMIKGMDK